MNTSIRLERLSLKSAEILKNLQSAGDFRAIVLQREGNRVVLDTAFGRLQGKSPDGLQKGDEILARYVDGKPEATVRILQQSTRVLTLPSPSLKNLFAGNSAARVMARVVSQDSQGSTISSAAKTFSIPQKAPLQSGDYLLLKQLNPQQVEVYRIKPETYLKAALSVLLPRIPQPSRGIDLTSMQQLATTLLRENAMAPEPGHSKAPVVDSGNASVGDDKSEAARTGRQDKAPLGESTPAAQRGRSGPSLLSLLDRLASPLARVQALDAQSIQRILQTLSLIKPGSTASLSPDPQALGQNLTALIRELKSSTDFQRQLEQLLNPRQDSAAQKPEQADSSLKERIIHVRNELIQQSEQTLNQLLTHKTRLSLQLEQNQPLQVHLNIPLQMEQEQRNLSLKIKQKKQADTAESEHWEIRLAFEIGNLGLISSHILLQETRLSAHFWAVKEPTKQLIEDNLQHFKNQLSKSGFELGLFDCFIGEPCQAEDADHSPLIDNLLDVEA